MPTTKRGRKKRTLAQRIPTSRRISIATKPKLKKRIKRTYYGEGGRNGDLQHKRKRGEMEEEWGEIPRKRVEKELEKEKEIERQAGIVKQTAGAPPIWFWQQQAHMLNSIGRIVKIPGEFQDIDGRYTIGKALGQGGFGIVYQVTDKLDGQMKVLKLFLNSLSKPNVLESVYHEITMTKMVNNILQQKSVKLYDTFVLEDSKPRPPPGWWQYITELGTSRFRTAAIVLELMDGTLYHLQMDLQKKYEQEKDIVTKMNLYYTLVGMMSRGLAEAFRQLQVLHYHHVYHMDFKGLNVLYKKLPGADEWKFSVSDFGTMCVAVPGTQFPCFIGGTWFYLPQKWTELENIGRKITDERELQTGEDVMCAFTVLSHLFQNYMYNITGLEPNSFDASRPSFALPNESMKRLLDEFKDKTVDFCVESHNVIETLESTRKIIPDYLKYSIPILDNLHRFCQIEFAKLNKP